jgi:hypothetical protein
MCHGKLRSLRVILAMYLSISSGQCRQYHLIHPVTGTQIFQCNARASKLMFTSLVVDRAESRDGDISCTYANTRPGSNLKVVNVEIRCLTILPDPLSRLGLVSLPRPQAFAKRASLAQRFHLHARSSKVRLAELPEQQRCSKT